MKSEPDSNGNSKPKAYIKERYLNGRLPAGSYVGAYMSVQEMKDLYGAKYYRQVTKMVNEFLNRGKKLPCVSSKITF